MHGSSGPEAAGETKRSAARAEAAGARWVGLDRHLIDSVAWTAAAKWTAQLVSWASFLVVARLLSPGDYGVMGMTAVYLGLVTVLSEFGTGSAIVNLRTLSDQQIKQLHTVSVLLGGGAAGLSFLAAAPLADFFRAPELRAVVWAMSGGFVLSGLRAAPYGLLQRELRFRLLAAVESGQTVAQAGVTITLAALGAGYWALVAGSLLGPGVATVWLLVCRSPGFAWPRWRSLRRVLGFGWAVLVANVGWYAYSNADFAIAGKVLGKSELGFYTLAWTMATLPGEKITAMITRVTPSFFAACQGDAAALRRYVSRLSEAISMITVPAVLGIALVAGDLIPVVLGAKWGGAVTPLVLLCISTGLSSGISIFPQVLNAVGRERRSMWNSVLKAGVLPAAFYVGSGWGTAGIAAVWLVVYPVLNLPLYGWGLQAIEMRPGEYLRALRPGWTGSLAMGVAVLVVKWATPGWPAALRLGAEMAVGAGVYALMLLTFERDRTVGYLRAAGRWRQSRAGA